ncbi:5659_t:CDS:2 [Scutellospora calospora]|uniref:5659_t:CDS:1 n=1 Tax=Scutellospora calospora TaxID=85575 RepID=A0ACA9MI54_9GLOM|nr:5659_t:CDS:2 [Scutellospora calospora]
MNYEVREDVPMLTAISPIQPTPIALPVEQDGSGHRETIIPLSPATPQEDSAGFSGNAGGLNDNGTFVAPQPANPSAVLAVEARPSAQPSTTSAISSPRYRSVLEAASPKNRNLPKAELLRRYIREKEDRIGRQTSQATPQ